MKFPLSTLLIIILLVFAGDVLAQKRVAAPPAKPKIPAVKKSGEIGQTAIVIDETLSVLRVKPSLFSDSVQRMHRGRKVHILGVIEADGVKFYKVTAPPSNYGWVQADAVFGNFARRTRSGWRDLCRLWRDSNR